MEGSCDISNEQSGTADKWWSCSLGVGHGATTPHYKNVVCYEML
jgi:hypothetical protein